MLSGLHVYHNQKVKRDQGLCPTRKVDRVEDITSDQNDSFWYYGPACQ